MATSCYVDAVDARSEADPFDRGSPSLRMSRLILGAVLRIEPLVANVLLRRHLFAIARTHAVVIGRLH